NTVPFAISLGCVAVGMTGLTRTFLTTKRHLPRADRALVILCALSVTAAVLAGVFPWPTAVGFALIVPITLLVLALSMIRWRQGFAPARYFTMAIAAYLLPAQLVLAQFFGLLPPNILTEYGTHVGAVLMAALYSFGLADHIRRLHQSSEKFVPTALLRQLGRESIAEVQLGDAVDARVTVLFSDIRSFTTLSEGMTPRQNFEFVNAFLARLVPPITAAGGIIDKYIGDAIMAIFPGNPANAAQAARAMMTALRSFNEENRNLYPPIAIGIGLHYGTVRLGTIGNAGRMNATVIADAVNLASRLESLTVEKQVPIIASEVFFQQLGDDQRSDFRYIGRTRVKGKVGETGIYEMLLNP
ncbi:MAG: adenylate/guanylate cyclase domain-containing protein, partial [Verrucomicrobiales bacterium]|nr:adenylate/guanylate cyclase domain-containing protein [Verrucomicrobiales bacterium]